MKPKSFNIFGQRIKIKYIIPPDGSDWMGLFVAAENLIIIDNRLKGDDLKSTLLHEFVHAVINLSGVNQTSLSNDVEEILCEQMSKAIIKNFKLQRN